MAAMGISALLALLAATRPAGAAPHVDVQAMARVEAAPRLVRKDGRRILEVEVTILAYVLSPEQPPDADRRVAVEMTKRVKVEHDLSCGGEDVSLSKGDRVELGGEYRHLPRSDRIAFTHVPKAGTKEDCDRPGTPAHGYLRKMVPTTPTPRPSPPRPADLVPEQPYRGTPAAEESPYLDILRRKEAGASDEELLEKIRAERTLYSLTTSDMQKLRAAGVSSRVIEAMLQSGRSAVTPVPTPR